MAVITYTPTERLVNPIGVEVSREFLLSSDRKKGLIYQQEFISLNGTREVVVQPRQDDDWTVGVTFIEEQDLSLWEEFFYSVVDGSLFQVDFFGTIAVPIEVRTMVMLTKIYEPTRESFQKFGLTFSTRELI